MSAIYLILAGGVLDGPITLLDVPGIGCQMPDNAIELPGVLIDPAESCVWVLVNGVPTQLVDHRGTVYSTVTGEPQQFDELGALPDGLTPDLRPSPTHAWLDGEWRFSAGLVAQLRAAAVAKAWELIKAERDRRTGAGFNVGTKWVHSDLFSRSQWLGLKDNARDALANGGAMVDGLLDSEGQAIVWKMLDGSFVPVTAQLAFDVVAAVTRSDMAIFTVAEQHRASMTVCHSPAEYDCTTGWPQTYAEWAAAQGAA